MAQTSFERRPSGAIIEEPTFFQSYSTTEEMEDPNRMVICIKDKDPLYKSESSSDNFKKHVEKNIHALGEVRYRRATERRWIKLRKRELGFKKISVDNKKFQIFYRMLNARGPYHVVDGDSKLENTYFLQTSRSKIEQESDIQAESDARDSRAWSKVASDVSRRTSGTASNVSRKSYHDDRSQPNHPNYPAVSNAGQQTGLSATLFPPRNHSRHETIPEHLGVACRQNAQEGKDGARKI